MTETTLKRKRVTTPRTEAHLTVSQRRYFDQLPDDLRAGFLEILGPIIVTPGQERQKNARQRLIHQRIGMLREIAEACEKRVVRLNAAWTRLERGEDVDVRELLVPPKVPGVRLGFEREKTEKGPEVSGNGQEGVLLRG